MRNNTNAELLIRCGGMIVLIVLLAAFPAPTVAGDPQPDNQGSELKEFAPSMELTKTVDDAVVSFADLALEQRVAKSARRLYEKALRSERQGRLEEAIHEMQAAIDVAPDFFRAHTALAVGYLKTGALHEAEQHARMALDLNPQYVPARHVHGLVLFSRAEYREAASTLSDVVKQAPERETAHYYLGLALRRLGDEQAAGQHLERAKELLQKPAPRLDWLRGLYRGWLPWSSLEHGRR